MNADFWNSIIRQHADAATIADRATKAVTPAADSPKLDTYRGWEITWDYGHFTATNPNYDASWEGEEDGWVDNGQCITARTREELTAEVDAWFEADAAPTPRSKPMTNQTPSPELAGDNAGLADELERRIRAGSFMGTGGFVHENADTILAALRPTQADNVLREARDSLKDMTDMVNAFGEDETAGLTPPEWQRLESAADALAALDQALSSRGQA